jgi:hypothetical protein|eukprot:COSAG01_NODE_1148_length_11519_cov_3.641944_17_plen_83_part_00
MTAKTEDDPDRRCSVFLAQCDAVAVAYAIFGLYQSDLVADPTRSGFQSLWSLCCALRAAAGPGVQRTRTLSRHSNIYQAAGS